MAPKPHYLPAALIGGFGMPEAGRAAGLRHAKVRVRRRQAPDKVFGPVKAENIAYQYGIYDVDAPSSDLPADFAETMWQEYEGTLPAAIRALEHGTFTRDDWKTILLHVQAQSIRHPDYERVAITYIQEDGVPAPERDHVQRQRQTTFRETRQWMANARFALIRRGTAAPRFVLNDKGYIPMHDTQLDLKGVLFPLSGETAVLMVVGLALPTDDYEAGPLAERTLNAKGMEIVNQIAWTVPEITCVMGHPGDADYLLQLSETGPTVRLPRLGPYRGNRDPGFYHWALDDIDLPPLQQGQDFRWGAQTA
ncbi:hypothetical protein ACQEWB_50510 [Streptomyces sp. CA-249302]|uniref:hypothetical protein n=1 Tax=Streptomyces sp. CA-249302 TaxID=3240058 RepID=UPI003D900C68